MSRDDGFLSRWSRRKVEARVGDAEPKPDPSIPERDEAPTDAAAPEMPSGREREGSGELSDAEVAALPRLDEITANTDLAPFLRTGVPDLIRNAALRRMWTTDPAIRDFVGEARDYSWDWNVVGGVPGHGPVLPSDDVGAIVSRLFNGPPAAEEQPGLSGGYVEPAARVATLADNTAEPAAQVATPADNTGPADEIYDLNRIGTDPGGASERAGRVVERNRCHGGAVPL